MISEEVSTNVPTVGSIHLQEEEEEEPKQLNQEKVSEFKKHVKNYLDIDDKIKKMNRSLKKLKKQRLEYYHDVIDFMSEYNIEHCNTKKGVLRCSMRKTKKAPSKSDLQDKLSVFLKDDEKASEAIKFIYDNREVVEKMSLRRLQNKKLSLNV